MNTTHVLIHGIVYSDYDLSTPERIAAAQKRHYARQARQDAYNRRQLGQIEERAGKQDAGGHMDEEMYNSEVFGYPDEPEEINSL